MKHLSSRRSLTMIIEEFLVKIRQEELLAEADRNRLLAAAKHKPDHSLSLGARFLTWLGGQLRRWGSRLEDRFAAESASTRSHSDDRVLKV